MEHKTHLINRIIAMSRAAQLARQLREIERVIDSMTRSTQVRLASLVVREIDQASRCQFPHLYGTPQQSRYTPWGTGTDTGLERLRSDNLPIRMRGIALWLAVAYHETRNSPYKATETLSRRIQGIVRRLRVSVPDAKPVRSRRVA